MTDTRCHSDNKRCVKLFSQFIRRFYHIDTFLAVGRLQHGNFGSLRIISVVLLVLRRKHTRLVRRHNYVSSIYAHIRPGKHRIRRNIHSHMLHGHHTAKSRHGRSDCRLHRNLFIWSPFCIYIFICRKIFQNFRTRCSRICRCIRYTRLICASCDGFIAGH